MSDDLTRDAFLPPRQPHAATERRTVASYERELRANAGTESRLREAISQAEILLRQKDDYIEKQHALGREADHRLMNGLQMIVSLLSLQARASTNAETAAQLAIAANRVATIERVHRRLDSVDGAQTVAFKTYLETLCADVAAMSSSDNAAEHPISVSGTEIQLPTATAIPLSFIVSELMTNAAKYGMGRILVHVEATAPGYALSVYNDGPSLPDGFDPSRTKGLGLKIVRTFIDKINGELRIDRGNDGAGVRFTVLFA